MPISRMKIIWAELLGNSIQKIRNVAYFLASGSRYIDVHITVGKLAL